MTSKGHWIFHQYIDIEEHFGFIYQITNMITMQSYIGKKQFKFRQKKKPTKKYKRTRISYKESDWKTYTGSCNKLNKDIEKYGIENFRFVILRLCDSKGSLAYWEAKTMWEKNVLTSTMLDGKYKYYNEQIPAVRGRWK